MTEPYRRGRSSLRGQITYAPNIFISHYCLYLLNFGPWPSMRSSTMTICDCGDVCSRKDTAAGTVQRKLLLPVLYTRSFRLVASPMLRGQPGAARHGGDLLSGATCNHSGKFTFPNSSCSQVDSVCFYRTCRKPWLVANPFETENCTDSHESSRSLPCRIMEVCVWWRPP